LNGCNQSLPAPVFTGGWRSYLGGVGGSLVGDLDLLSCIGNVIACAKNIATGQTYSDAYVRWLHRHGVETGIHSQYGAGLGSGITIQMLLGLVASPASAAAPADAASGLGDLTNGEVRTIQGIVNQAGRPLDVVGSAARGLRRGVGTDLPIGKGPGTKSDIDFMVAHSNVAFFEKTGLYKELPDLDKIIPGVPNPFDGPSIRFEPFTRPYFIPEAP
jgi:hypothetical protein